MRSLKKALEMKPDEIIKTVTESGLRGRGGAGFCAGQKWSFIPKEKKGPHYLAVNADESEPGTFKDRYLIDYDPHSMLEGIAIASIATQCDIAYIFIRGEYHRQAKVLEQRDQGSVRATRSSGSRGSSASQYKLECYVHRGAGAYICGEETGLLEALEGKRGWPRNKPPFPAIAGAFARPTVINNVETLCCVPHIIETRAGSGLRSMGTPSSPGPKLFGMSRPREQARRVRRRAGHHARLRDQQTGRRDEGREVQRLHLRRHLAWACSGPNQLDIKLDFDDVRFRGGCLGLGTAGMIVMNEHTDMVAALRNCVRFYAHESCGQCTPCREGIGLDAQDPRPHHRRRRPGAAIWRCCWSWKRPWASCPARRSAAWPMAPPGRRGRSSTSITTSSPRGVRRSRIETVPLTIRRGKHERADADGEQHAVAFSPLPKGEGTRQAYFVAHTGGGVI